MYLDSIKSVQLLWWQVFVDHSAAIVATEGFDRLVADIVTHDERAKWEVSDVLDQRSVTSLPVEHYAPTEGALHAIAMEEEEAGAGQLVRTDALERPLGVESRVERSKSCPLVLHQTEERWQPLLTGCRLRPNPVIVFEKGVQFGLNAGTEQIGFDPINRGQYWVFRPEMRRM